MEERLLLQIYNWFYLGHVVGHRMRVTLLRRWRHTNSCSGSSGYNAVWKVSYWPRWRHSRSHDKLPRSTFFNDSSCIYSEFICEEGWPRRARCRKKREMEEVGKFIHRRPWISFLRTQLQHASREKKTNITRPSRKESTCARSWTAELACRRTDGKFEPLPSLVLLSLSLFLFLSLVLVHRQESLAIRRRHGSLSFCAFSTNSTYVRMYIWLLSSTILSTSHNVTILFKMFSLLPSCMLQNELTRSVQHLLTILQAPMTIQTLLSRSWRKSMMN